MIRTKDDVQGQIRYILDTLDKLNNIVLPNKRVKPSDDVGSIRLIDGNRLQAKFKDKTVIFDANTASNNSGTTYNPAQPSYKVIHNNRTNIAFEDLTSVKIDEDDHIFHDTSVADIDGTHEIYLINNVVSNDFACVLSSIPEGARFKMKNIGDVSFEVSSAESFGIEGEEKIVLENNNVVELFCYDNNFYSL